MIASNLKSGLFGGGGVVLPPSGASFVLGLEHPVVSGKEITLEETKYWRSSVKRQDTSFVSINLLEGSPCPSTLRGSLLHASTKSSPSPSCHNQPMVLL